MAVTGVVYQTPTTGVPPLVVSVVTGGKFRVGHHVGCVGRWPPVAAHKARNWFSSRCTFCRAGASETVGTLVGSGGGTLTIWGWTNVIGLGGDGGISKASNCT